MTNSVLTVNTKAYLDIFVPSDSMIGVHPTANHLFRLEHNFVERDICETDGSTLQVIPYLILASQPIVDNHTQPSITSPETKFFVYTRGSKGTEERLHAKQSIGVGGHIDLADDKGNFKETFAAAAFRELAEEVGVVIEYNAESANGFSDSLLTTIWNPVNEVGKVHIGVISFVFVSPEAINTEKGVIVDSKWMTLEEIKTAISTSEIQLEDWSDILINELSNVVAAAKEEIEQQVKHVTDNSNNYWGFDVPNDSDNVNPDHGASINPILAEHDARFGRLALLEFHWFESTSVCVCSAVDKEGNKYIGVSKDGCFRTPQVSAFNDMHQGRIRKESANLILKNYKPDSGLGEQSFKTISFKYFEEENRVACCGVDFAGNSFVGYNKDGDDTEAKVISAFKDIEAQQKVCIEYQNKCNTFSMNMLHTFIKEQATQPTNSVFTAAPEESISEEETTQAKIE